MKSRLDEDSETFIDAFRGLAAWGVLLTHAIDIGIAGVYGQDMTLTPISWRWARASIGHGGFLVWCFFVISGLCIHQSIARSVETGTFSWRRYFAARVSRIYPLFTLGLLLAVLVWWFTDAPNAVKPWPQFFSSLVSLQILTNTFPNYDPSWSLSNEMIYYFVWPLVLLCFTGRNSNRALLLSMVVTFFVAVCIMSLWKVFHRFEHSALTRGLWTITVLFPLWAGGAWLGSAWKTVREKISLRFWLWSMLLCVLSGLFLVVLKFQDSPTWATDLAGLSSMPGLMIFIAGAHHAQLSSYGWTKRVSQWLGQFSYPCYVLHYQIMIMLDRIVLPKPNVGLASNPILRSLMLLVPVSLLLAIVGPWIERRTMAWRANFLARMQARPAAPRSNI